MNDMDGMDSYLGICLKNWAAQQQPPVDGRERLLRSLASSPAQPKNSYITRLWQRIFAPQPVYRPSNNWLLVPFTQSRAWSFHIADTLYKVA